MGKVDNNELIISFLLILIMFTIVISDSILLYLGKLDSGDFSTPMIVILTLVSSILGKKIWENGKKVSK